jgi:hypothetical protein
MQGAAQSPFNQVQHPLSTSAPSQRIMQPNSRAANSSARPNQIKQPIYGTSISPSISLPSKAAPSIRNLSLASTSPQILRATAGAKSPLFPFSPPTSSLASAASSRSTQRAPSLDASFSPPSTPNLEIESASSTSSRDIADVRRLRSHVMRLESLTKDAQQRLEAETQALRQVQQIILQICISLLFTHSTMIKCAPCVFRRTPQPTNYARF